jgi:hypothetical protein
VRPAIAHRHAEALRGADDDIRAHLARRRQQRQSESGSAATMARPPAACTAAISARQVAHLAGRAGILQHQREGLLAAQAPRSRPARRPPPAKPSGSARVRTTARSADAHRPRSTIVSDLPLRRGMGQRHRLGRRGRLVEQRGIGDRQAGEVVTMVWKFSSASSRPCAISAW